MVIGCPSGSFFKTPPGVDSIEVPSIIKVDRSTSPTPCGPGAADSPCTTRALPWRRRLASSDARSPAGPRRSPP